jgi:hypothetical protein
MISRRGSDDLGSLQLWVLGDLVGLDAWLKSNAESQPVILA